MERTIFEELKSDKEAVINAMKNGAISPSLMEEIVVSREELEKFARGEKTLYEQSMFEIGFMNKLNGRVDKEDANLIAENILSTAIAVNMPLLSG